MIPELPLHHELDKAIEILEKNRPNVSGMGGPINLLKNYRETIQDTIDGLTKVAEQQGERILKQQEQQMAMIRTIKNYELKDLHISQLIYTLDMFMPLHSAIRHHNSYKFLKDSL